MALTQLEAAAAPGNSGMPQAVLNPQPGEQARFNLSDILLDSESEDDDHRPQRTHSPLDDIMVDGNQFFDSDRNELFFSAGAENTGNSTRRQELLEGMRNLEYYDHTVFGKTDREDPTISDAVAAMVDMDLLDNLLRLRLSDDQLKTIIWVMRECKTPDVPSFSALRKKQAELTKNVSIKTTRHDWVNPLVREFIQVYPKITDHISEFKQADKWTKEVELNDLSPMWADWKKAGHKHFYVKELAQLKNGDFVIPIRWVIINKEEYAESGCFVIHDENYNYLDLRETGYSLKFPESSPEWAKNMPNPMRKIAKGCPVFSMRIIPWSDDVSGNVSKQFNPHMNVYIANANLPHRKVSQDGRDKYHEAYDCKLDQEILFRIFAHALPADNPQQAESASNASVHANFWCRYDSVGGAAAERETNEGYHALFKPGIGRTPTQTIRTIKHQIWAACSGVQDAVDALQTSTGNKKLKGEARKAVKTRIKDLIQWELYNWVIMQPEDPCEILHTILLGDDKYIWHETNKPWDKTKADTFAVRLQSSSTSGLNLSSLRGRYIVKYKNALIGKHFKVLQQLGAFHLHEDLCSKNLFELWKAAGELGAMLCDLQICIDNDLDLWGLIDPARIMTKYKLHVLSHLPDDIRRFGPAILVATEGFECWNAIFRLCSILSNHQSPSHDIGVTLADMERFKHQISGGWWKDLDSNQYVQAGHKIISFLDKNRDLQRRLSWMDKSKPKLGSIKLDSRQTATTASWRDILDPVWALELDTGGAETIWTTCKYVVSQVGDICQKQSWVFFKCKRQNSERVLAGRIWNILIPVTTSTQHETGVVVVRRFVVSATQDEHMNMPVLSPSPNTYLVKPKRDCFGNKFQVVSDAEIIMQERRATGLTQAAICHKETETYFINMHALHNANLLHETLPRALTAPIPFFLRPRRQTHRICQFGSNFRA
ncbi:hypothetical protein B0H14DRAFT_3085998 [Mycena olivaceomarginata]|nr:hypothetical protein B0H14DRAFT_3085998 [Mycena olivaceomarginata]